MMACFGMQHAASRWLSAIALFFGIHAIGDDVRLTPRTLVTFADVETARTILTSQDDFIRALSPFDRAARMKSDQPRSQMEFLTFLGQNVQPWADAEIVRVSKVLVELSSKLTPYHLPLPQKISLIKTTGKEEGAAAYTRGSAIILPQHDVEEPSRDLLAHELFHVMSRYDGSLRSELYRVIGFVVTNEVRLPAGLANLRITNPDGPLNNSIIVVREQGQDRPVVPILYSRSARYDVTTGGEFFNYLDFKLLAVAHDGKEYRPHMVNGEPYLLKPDGVIGFFEQIGRNTDYIIHPDEILAVNFVYMVNGRTNLPSPRIPSQMKEILKASSAPAGGAARN